MFDILLLLRTSAPFLDATGLSALRLLFAGGKPARTPECDEIAKLEPDA